MAIQHDTSKRTRPIDLMGQTFGRLSVIARAAENRKSGEARWICRCSCGGSRVVPGRNLRSGRTQSCGCIKREKLRAERTTHGKCKTPTYKVWCRMINRCYRDKDERFKNYGGRGITVCDRWRQSFSHFLEDMGDRPGEGYSIDRINNDGNYCPENCHWILLKDQASNKSNNRIISGFGEEKYLGGWAKISGIAYYTLRYRLNGGLTLEQAFAKSGFLYSASFHSGG